MCFMPRGSRTKNLACRCRIGVIHIMLVGFGKIKDDASYKYHENEGVIGWILLVLRLSFFLRLLFLAFARLGLYGWFLWAVQSSAREAPLRKGHLSGT